MLVVTDKKINKWRRMERAKQSKGQRAEKENKISAKSKIHKLVKLQ